MGKFTTLTELYGSKNGPVAIAHRGACHVMPENTIPAMRRAVELGADMIEFDLRMTRDGIPVLLHDPTIDRTSNGTGKPGDYTLAELKTFNFGKMNNCLPDDFIQIPTFEEILAEFREQCGMNIQVYADSENDLKAILDLYKKYDMYDRGFLALSTFAAAERSKAIDPKADFGILEGWKERSLPERLIQCRNAGARFAQPIRVSLTPESLPTARKIGLLANVFVANTEEEILPLIKDGASGILTNHIDVLVKLVGSGLR